MSQASEQIARQYANGANVQRIWKDIIINVKEYGAKGDGKTDDTVAIQQALNDGSGKTVIFPPGEYKITSTLVINNTITIQGTYGKTLIKNYGANSAIQVKTKCKIYGILQTASVNGSNQHGLLLSASHCIFEDCEFQGNGGYGIKFDPTVHVVNTSVSNTIIFANQLGGVYCVTNVNFQKTAAHFDNCYVSGNGSETNPTVAQITGGHGFELGACLGVTITNSVSEYNKGCGVYIAEEGIYGVFNVVVTGCYFEGNRRANIHFNNTNASLAYKEIFIKANYYSAYPATGPTYYTNSLLPTSIRTIVQNKNYITESVIDEGNYGFSYYDILFEQTNGGRISVPDVVISPRFRTYAASNGSVTFANAVILERDAGDANPVSIIRNLNGAHTGDFLHILNGASVKFKFKRGGGIVMTDKRTIASATTTGEVGEFCWDDNYLYMCIAANTWKRVAIATW